jgi:hypothetical protein
VSPSRRTGMAAAHSIIVWEHPLGRYGSVVWSATNGWRNRLIIGFSLVAIFGGCMALSGCGGSPKAGSFAAATLPNTSPIPREMEQWLRAADSALLALSAGTALISGAVTGINNVAIPPEPVPPNGLDAVLASGACSDMQHDLATAEAVPSAPIPEIQSAWKAQLAPVSTIVAQCDTAASGDDSSFPEQWPELVRSLGPPGKRMQADLNALGYCLPSATCQVPYRTSR